MATPFEELEYIADHLPEEGESIIVSREYGDIVCRPYQPEMKASKIIPEYRSQAQVVPEPAQVQYVPYPLHHSHQSLRCTFRMKEHWVN